MPAVGNGLGMPAAPATGDGASADEGELLALHVRYARDRDRDVLDELVEHYRPYAEAYARRHYRNVEPLDDLTQVANEALIHALHRFEPDRGTPFLGFAQPTIVGSLRRHVRDAGWAIRVPRWVHELARPTRDAVELLTHDLGRAPTPAEVADLLGVDEQEVLDASAAEAARATRSLDTRDTASGLQTEEIVGRIDPGLTGIENRTALAQSLKELSEDDRELVRMYFIDGMSQVQIAEVLGCSQMQVSRLLRTVVRRLRHLMLRA
jgi:RNA polymerase sigma-B factor